MPPSFKKYWHYYGNTLIVLLTLLILIPLPPAIPGKVCIDLYFNEVSTWYVVLRKANMYHLKRTDCPLLFVSKTEYFTYVAGIPGWLHIDIDGYM